MVNATGATAMPQDTKQHCGELHKAPYVQTRGGLAFLGWLNCKLLTAQTTHGGEDTAGTHGSKRTKQGTQISPALVSSTLQCVTLPGSNSSNALMYYSHSQDRASRQGSAQLASLNPQTPTRIPATRPRSEDAGKFSISLPSQKVKLCKPALASGLN